MELELLRAGRGDAFILIWGEEHSKLLIDGGTPIVYKQIRKSIKQLSELKAIFITHIDYDHIGGIIGLIRDKRRNDQIECPIFINTPNLVLTPSVDPKVGIKHGTQLLEIFDEQDLNHHSVIREEMDQIEIDGLKLTILSPNKEIIDQLISDWTANEIYQEYLQAKQVESKVSNEQKEISSAEDIIADKESIKEWDKDLINSSSISFVAEYEGVRVLLLGDAHPEVISHSLRSLGYSESNKLELNAVKVSHHGSKHNTTSNLLKLVKTNKYIISTNGSGPYYHPHRETIVRIAHFGQKLIDEDKVQIIFNYPPKHPNQLLTVDEREKYDVEFKTLLRVEL